jgi:hypothetical protein
MARFSRRVLMRGGQGARAFFVTSAAAAGITALGAFAPTRPREIHIVATDYAYIDVPATVRPGLTYFGFRNAGKVRHEMSLLRLESGVSPATVVENFRSGGKGRAAFFKTVGLLIEPPGGSTIGWLAMELKHGETYMLFCTLRDKPDAQQHFELGMYSAFTVR